MSTSVFGSPPIARAAEPSRPVPFFAAGGRPRQKPRGRTIGDIATTVGVLVLMMLGGLALPLLLSLSSGVLH
jgi:hypothetical protein